jgi:hypothetical protein
MIWILMNTVTLGALTLPAGRLIDDAQYDPKDIADVGGVLWPSSDPSVAAAAALVRSRQQSKGIDESSATAIMYGAAIKQSSAKLTS